MSLEWFTLMGPGYYADAFAHMAWTTVTDTPAVRYRCPTCKKRFERPAGVAYSCCVVHLPGDCCHAFEVPVHKKGWRKR